MKTISALTLIFLSTCFCSLYGDESTVEYFNLTHENTSFTLGEGDVAEVIMVAGDHRRRFVYNDGVSEASVYVEFDMANYPKVVGPAEISYYDDGFTVLIAFKISRAETTPTVSPTSAAASSLLSGWTWMETYPLIYNNSTDTWFYLMPVVIDGTATNWLYNYKTEQWSDLLDSTDYTPTNLDGLTLNRQSEEDTEIGKLFITFDSSTNIASGFEDPDGHAYTYTETSDRVATIIYHFEAGEVTDTLSFTGHGVGTFITEWDNGSVTGSFTLNSSN